LRERERVKPLFEFFKDELMIVKEIDQTLRENLCFFCDQGLFGSNRRRNRHDLRHFLMCDGKDVKIKIKIKRVNGMKE